MTELRQIKSTFWTVSVFVALMIGGVIYTVYKNNDKGIQMRNFNSVTKITVNKHRLY